MMYSFEGTDVSVAKETKCEVEVCKPGLTFYDADVTSPWDVRSPLAEWMRRLRLGLMLCFSGRG